MLLLLLLLLLLCCADVLLHASACSAVLHIADLRLGSPWLMVEPTNRLSWFLSFSEFLSRLVDSFATAVS